MKPVVTYPDSEREVRDALADLFPRYWTGVQPTVGVGVPTKWSVLSSLPHLQVSADGTPLVQDHPVRVGASIRIVAWSNSTTNSKAMATLAMGLMLAHCSWGKLSGVRPLTGPQSARDEDTKGELCYVSLRVNLRSIPVLERN